MPERNLNFDNIIDRRNTYSLKYDFAERRGMPADVLPLWVADMDFPVSSYIQDALAEFNNMGIYGYSETKEDYFEVVKAWMKRHYDWEIGERRELIKTPGIVFAIAMAIKAFTEVGDAVLINSPVYYPFTEAIEDNERRVVSSDLVQNEDGRYYIDLEDLERKITENNIALYLLCNPHNPGGSAWSKEELSAIGEICLKHNVIVVSDEIHADFTWKGAHTVFANISKALADITITCTSPSKSFNVAGLQISNIIIQNPRIRERFRRQVAAAGYSQVSSGGIVGCVAAYTHGDEWLAAVRKYILDNLEYAHSYLQEKLPWLGSNVPEATYLMWLDFRKSGLSDEEINRRIIHEAKLWLDAGSIFGAPGAGFQRINAACPRAILAEALERLVKVF